MTYDVIVIGAGPTGSSAARELATDGFKVLLVERFKMPKRKIDSGILIKKTEELIKAYFKEAVPEAVTCLPKIGKGMVLTVDDGTEFKYEQPTLNVWRNSFDMWLAERAVAAGAEFRDETAVISCEERAGDVIVKLRGKTDYTEKAKVVISCDGAMGAIKQRLTGTASNNIFVYETFNKGAIDIDPEYFYTYLQPDLAEHSAWFNVKDDYLIFGVAGQNIGKIDHYYSEFMGYMKLKHNARIDVVERQERWTMPTILPGCPINYGKGRVMFAGESAGFLNPISEGLSSAIESGHAAADAIRRANNFDMKAIYDEYKKALTETEEYMKRQWSLIASKSAKFAYMK